MLDQLGLDFKWLIVTAGAIIAGAVKYLHSRITALEALMRDGEKAAAAEARAENDKLWEAMDRHRADFSAFKDSVLRDTVTKADLSATEKRIMAAVEKSR